MERALATSEVAWYQTGRFYQREDGRLADCGYFLHLAGITASLFNGAVSETRAHFAFAAQPFVPASASNGALTLGLDPAGEFSIYLHSTAGADFDQPESFASGQRIATFRRTGLVMGATVESAVPSSSTKSHALFSSNVFTARLIESVPFEFDGRRYNLAKALGAGITQFGTMAGVPIEPPAPGYVTVVPFCGSAVALG